MFRTSLRLTALTSVLASALMAAASGRIVAAHDVNTLATEKAGADEQRFAVNVAQWLMGARSGHILAIESLPTDSARNYASSVRDALNAAGFTVTYRSNLGNSGEVAALTLADLEAYDAVFVGITWPKPYTTIAPDVLTSYVERGGNVYIYGGVDSYAWDEAPLLNPFLSAFGLAFAANDYNGLMNVTVTSTHPIFNGVAQLGCGNGQSVINLGTNPNAQVVQFVENQGVYAVVEAAAPPPPPPPPPPPSSGPPLAINLVRTPPKWRLPPGFVGSVVLHGHIAPKPTGGSLPSQHPQADLWWAR